MRRAGTRTPHRPTSRGPAEAPARRVRSGTEPSLLRNPERRAAGKGASPSAAGARRREERERPGPTWLGQEPAPCTVGSRSRSAPLSRQPPNDLGPQEAGGSGTRPGVLRPGTPPGGGAAPGSDEERATPTPASPPLHRIHAASSPEQPGKQHPAGFQYFTLCYGPSRPPYFTEARAACSRVP